LTIQKVVLLIALLGAVGMAWMAAGCASNPCPAGTPELRVDRVVDRFGNVVTGQIDLTRLPAGWKVRLVSSQAMEPKASAYDAKGTMTHGSFPTNPTVGDEHYYNGRYYGYCGKRWGGWAPRVPGAASVTPDGPTAAWVTFATVGKPMAVVIVATCQGRPVGMPLVIGVDPSANLGVSFPPVREVVVGQPYLITIVGGYASWQIPDQGIGLYVTYGGERYLVGVLMAGANGQLIATFGEGLNVIRGMIPYGVMRTLTVEFEIDGERYTFPITVIGTGDGGDDHGGDDGDGGVLVPID
jgi:hypothetical protein